MIRKCSTYAISAALLVLSSSALAQVVERGDVYVGAQLGMAEVQTKDEYDNANIPAISSRLGTYFNRYISLEGRIGVGITEDTIDFSGTDVDAELDRFFGGYVRAHFPVVDFFHVYVIGGITKVKATLSADVLNTTYSNTETETGDSLGVGVDYHGEGGVTLSLEAIQYVSDAPGTEAVNFGLAKRF